MIEEWRDIKGYEGKYQVSNFGRVKSLPVGGNGRGKGGWKNERILKCYTNHNNHQYVTLCKNGIGKHQFIHRLVAIAFPEICGEWFKDAQVHHIDFNPSNNKADNLILISKEEHIKIHQESDVTHNRRSLWQIGVKKNYKTSNRTKAKVVLQYDLDGNLIKEWDSTREIQRELGFYTSNISLCCRGIKLKKAYGYVWKYKN